MSTDAVIIAFPGTRAPVVPALPVVTATGPVLNLCDQPVVSSRCASLVQYEKQTFPCRGLLAYQGGQWQHVNACEDCYQSPGSCHGSFGHRSCDNPQPATCQHGTCNEPTDIEIQCVNGSNGDCCGCCWVATGHIDVDDGAGWSLTQQRWA